VDYEILPIVLTLHDAMKPDAPLLHEEMTTRFRVERFARGAYSGRRLPLIPVETCHRFQSKVATDSD
jgi:hypothetical protein